MAVAQPTQRRAWTVAGAALWLLAAGCPGRLEDPERFQTGTHDRPDAGFTDAGSAGSACELDIDVVQDLLVPRCGSSGCHGGPEPAADLDVTALDLVDSLVDAPATQCDGEVRVDSAAPEDSYLLRKLEGPVDGCGDRMPLIGTPLSDEELACVREWTREIVP